MKGTSLCTIGRLCTGVRAEAGRLGTEARAEVGRPGRCGLAELGRGGGPPDRPAEGGRGIGQVCGVEGAAERSTGCNNHGRLPMESLSSYKPRKARTSSKEAPAAARVLRSAHGR